VVYGRSFGNKIDNSNLVKHNDADARYLALQHHLELELEAQLHRTTLDFTACSLSLRVTTENTRN